MSKAIILDVGHGNSALIRGKGCTAVVDSPRGGTLLNALKHLGINHVDYAFISHADEDHIAGILSLLTSERVTVGSVYVNPDAMKKTEIWKDFLFAVRDAECRGSPHIKTSLSSTSPGHVTVADVKIEVLGPSAALALSGVGGNDSKGRRRSSNTLSATIAVGTKLGARLLLAGDIDLLALEDMIGLGKNLRAATLVFPHHGGLPGNPGKTKAFCDKLLEQVQPDFVIFSNGHGRHDNPRPDVVEHVLKAGCKVACTQLSKRCCEDLPKTPPDHLENLPAKGRFENTSCAGSMELSLRDNASRDPGFSGKHATFVSQSVPDPLCLISQDGSMIARKS